MCVCVYTHTHTHISDCVDIVYDELSLLPNNTVRKSFLHIGIRAMFCLDIYNWFAGLTVTGSVCDIR